MAGSFYFTAAALLNVAMGELDGEEGGGGSGAHPVTAMRVALGKSSRIYSPSLRLFPLGTTLGPSTSTTGTR